MKPLRAIDLFAGLGGWTLAAQMLGIHVAWAANHWPVAVDAHAANHPDTQHSCQDLHQADWTRVPAHDVLLASPCCQGHTKARGKDRPHHDSSRATAWAVVSCAEVHQPPLVIVENVVDFRGWTLFPAWCDALARLGYSLTEHVLDAADCGVPQNRVRLFVVARRVGASINLLENINATSKEAARGRGAGRDSCERAPRNAGTTGRGCTRLGSHRVIDELRLGPRQLDGSGSAHAHHGNCRCGICSAAGRAGVCRQAGGAERQLSSYATAADFIDFRAGNWSCVRHYGRARRTIERWMNGREQHGRRFLFSFYGNTKGGRSLDRPIGTITTRDRWAVVDGDRMRMLTVDEARIAMSFPDGYRLPANGRLAMHLLGNAVPPLMARHVLERELIGGAA